MEWIRTDLKYALRALLRRPAMSALAVFTLAIGLGVNTVAFSAVNALVFRPFHIPGGDVAGWVFTGTTSDQMAQASEAVFDAIARQSRTLEAVAAEGRESLALDLGGETLPAWALMVSPDYFTLIPAPIVAGRALERSDHLATDIAVLVSERFWRSRLNADPDLRVSLVLNRQTAHVVGVIADGFQGPGGVFEPEIWTPLSAARAFALPQSRVGADHAWLTLIARPVAGIPAGAVVHELTPIVAAASGRGPSDLRVQYVPIADGHPEARAFRPVAAVALTAVGMVLLIACFNVAGLLLAQSVGRQRDLGMRSALGASRGRLVRQMLTEGLVLAVIAGISALVLARWTEGLLSAFSLPAPIPQRLHFAVDQRLVAYGAVVSLAAAILPTIVPAWQMWRADLTRWMRASASSAVGGKAQARARRILLVLQVAGSTVFLICAAIFGRSFLQSYAADPGFDTRHIVTLEVSPTRFGYTPERARTLADALAERTAAVSGVEAVSVADRVPFSVGFPRSMSVKTNDNACEPPACPRATAYAVDDQHTGALHLAIHAGRSFDRTRTDDRDAVIVNDAAAAKFWPGQYPVAQSFHDETGRTRVVLGVVNDISTSLTPGGRPTPLIYRPIEAGDFASGVTIVVRTSGDPGRLVQPLRAALRALDPTVPPDSIQTMTERMALSLWPIRTLAGFFGICGVLALLLATVGLFGVTHYVVGQRTREFGVRLAIGASEGALQRLVLSESIRLIAPGLILGLLVGTGLNMTIKSQLVGLESADPRIFALAVVLEVFVALTAAWLPARRAGRTDPLVALRAD